MTRPALALAAVILAGCAEPLPVAFTNGDSIVVRPEFLDGLTNPDERAFVWAHELAHLLRGHHVGAALGEDRDDIERDADLWAARTVALYGYSPCAGVRFLQRHGQTDRAAALAQATRC